jgi:hypothetical protein
MDHQPDDENEAQLRDGPERMAMLANVAAQKAAP